MLTFFNKLIENNDLKVFITNVMSYVNKIIKEKENENESRNESEDESDEDEEEESDFSSSSSSAFSSTNDEQYKQFIN